MAKNNTFVSILLVAALVVALLIAFERMRIMPQATEDATVVQIVESDSVEEPKVTDVPPVAVEGLGELLTTEIEAVSNEPEEEAYYWKAFASMRQPAVSDPNSEQNQATLRRLREMRRARIQAEQSQ
ncbi:hypothetical protein [Cerasicoccus frondis]|uniref:hypothetical protein n=1 Tax=Cerasicoccus frondis TaxID=490090 RepID=UPI0028529F18|nr:hypothetical protein [Cerasicoccus frondis]